MKWIDKRIEKFGYVKIEENSHGVRYEKVEKQGYTHVIIIGSKSSGKHLLHSYDKECIDVPGKNFPINEVVGIEANLLLLLWIKFKWLAKKYHWKRFSK